MLNVLGREAVVKGNTVYIDGDTITQASFKLDKDAYCIAQIYDSDGNLVKAIEVGQQAWVRLEAYPRVELSGRILDISTLAQEFQGNVKVFPAVIRLDEADPRARPGMTASTDIVVERLDDVVQVPLAAVGVIDGQTYVRLHLSHQTVEVTLGLWNESMAQVLAGLDVGEEVDLAWLQDPAAVLATLAGTRTVPEEMASAIVALGDEYGAASPVVSMDELMMQGGAEESGRGRGNRGGSAGETGARMQTFDMTRLTPEAIEQMRQGVGREGEAGGDVMVTREGATAEGRQGGTGRTRPGAEGTACRIETDS